MTAIDTHTTIDPTLAFPLSTYADETVTGTTIDTQNFESVEFILASGAFGAAATATPVLEESINAADWTTVDADFILGSIAGASFANDDDNQVRRIGYVGKDRYVRLSMTVVSTANDLVGIAVLGHARSQPTDESTGG